ncbi:HDOD domain-containing protein [Candidatus Poribacteria bacterium]|nr:HDOD domain-containing protein [Candidatus Poribacteria bacterium]
MKHSRGQIKAKVDRIQTLPTMAKVGMRVIELASSQEVSMADLSRAIHQDASFAARVLKIANSPFYGMPRQVDSLQLALVILGLNEIQNIALGLSVFNVIRNMNSHPTRNREQFWLHSAGCGIVARILARALGLHAEGTDFAAGLLHDIGKIVIDEFFGEEFDLIHEKAATKNVCVLEAEEEVLGESHAHIGGWLAEKWQLPDILCGAIMCHHDSAKAPAGTFVKDPKIAALSYVAEGFCGCHEIGWDGDSRACDMKSPDAWDILLAGQSKRTRADIDAILEETLQAYRETRPQMLWE